MNILGGRLDTPTPKYCRVWIDDIAAGTGPTSKLPFGENFENDDGDEESQSLLALFDKREGERDAERRQC